jgi:putative FmdB family regulatory protein
MPTYEYVCTECGEHVEAFQRLSDPPLAMCAVCGGRLRKLFHPPGIVLKGSGFYSTDSRQSGKSTSKRSLEPASGSSSSSEHTPADKPSDKSSEGGKAAASSRGKSS